MPHEIVWGNRCAIKRFWGFVGAEEFIRSAEEVASDPRFDGLRFIVNDCLAVTGHSVDAEALERLAVIRFGATMTNPNVRVLVVTTDGRIRTLVDSVNEPPLAGLIETRSFESMDSAKAWMADQPPLDRVPARFLCR